MAIIAATTLPALGVNGSIHITLRDAKVDGKSVQMARTTQNGMLSGTQQSILILKSDEGFSATVNGLLAKGRVFSALIDIEIA